MTDNTAVMWLLRKSECSSRLQRWIVCIQEFDFEVVHIPGKQNAVADALSRLKEEGGTEVGSGGEVASSGGESIEEYAEVLWRIPGGGKRSRL